MSADCSASPSIRTSQSINTCTSTTPRRRPAVHNRVSRFTASGDVAAAGSEVVLLDLDNLSSATNHNGGALNFGPDGKLYVAVGENANGANAQTLSNLLGKMLRLNADGTIPTDNPFYASATGQEPGDLGARPAQPLHVRLQSVGLVDVRQRRRTERPGKRSTTALAGANYGWPDTEGADDRSALRQPSLQLRAQHGGAAARSPAARSTRPPTAQFPSDYLDDYFFADYCAGWIRRLDPANNNAVTTFATGIASPVDLKVSRRRQSLLPRARERRDDGRRLSRQLRRDCADASPRSRRAAAPRRERRSPSASRASGLGAAAVSVAAERRQHLGRHLAGLHASPSVATADNGARFRAIVSNDSGSATSAEAVLTVTSNQAPTAHDHLAGGGHALQRRKRHQLLGLRLRSRRRRRSPRAPSPGGWTSITTRTATRSSRQPRE